METKEFISGDTTYVYGVIVQKRKTMSLTVFPDKRIVVKCPPSMSQDLIEAFLQKKSAWLNKKLQQLEAAKPLPPEKKYLVGEKFLYLGCQYSLAVMIAPKDMVSISGEKLWVYTTRDPSDGEHNRILLAAWFKEQADKVLRERFDSVFWTFDYPTQPILKIRAMKTRWGSCSTKESINLNSNLVQASTDLIDYVIMHELCHLIEHNHSPKFYALLDRMMPNWKQRKKSLDTLIF